MTQPVMLALQATAGLPATSTVSRRRGVRGRDVVEVHGRLMRRRRSTGVIGSFRSNPDGAPRRSVAELSRHPASIERG